MARQRYRFEGTDEGGRKLTIRKRSNDGNETVETQDPPKTSKGKIKRAEKSNKKMTQLKQKTNRK